MRNDNAVIVIFGILGLGLLFLLTTRSSSSEESIALPFKPASLVGGTHHYTNKEKWSIKWNEDGLPSEVIIERDARQT